MDWKDEVHRLRSEQKSLSEITRSIMPLFPGCTEHQVWEKVHSATRIRSVRSMDDKPTLVFADAHVPFDHPGFLPFLVDTYKKYGCGEVINLGDQTDQHAWSRFEKETTADGPCEEHAKAIARNAAYFAAFPKGKLCASNHDDRIYRRAASAGIDRRFLKPFREIYGVPGAWEIEDEFIVNGVLYKHGENCAGDTGAMRTALKNCMSTCIGHFHGQAGCKYTANARDMLFGMNVGCGVDRKAYAFAYGKNDKDKPILGCGVVYNSSSATFVPMSSEYFRN